MRTAGDEYVSPKDEVEVVPAICQMAARDGRRFLSHALGIRRQVAVGYLTVAGPYPEVMSPVRGERCLGQFPDRARPSGRTTIGAALLTFFLSFWLVSLPCVMVDWISQDITRFGQQRVCSSQLLGVLDYLSHPDLEP